MTQRVQALLREEPEALHRTFGDYGLFPWDAQTWHTPLAYAVVRGRGQIVRLLIEAGAVKTLRSPEGENLGEIAVKSGHREIALLLERAEGVEEARS